MKKIIILPALLAALFALPCMAADKPAIVIGDSFAYASFARFGGPYKKGWQLAVDDINDKGGVCFAKDDCRLIKVVSVDHTDDPARALGIVEGLIERDKASALAGTVLTNVTNAVGTLAGQKKIPIITVWSSVLASEGPQNDYMFSMMPVEPHSLASADLAATLPIKKWALIGPDIAWGRTGNALFKERLQQLRPDVEFVAQQWPPLMKFDQAAEFAALRKASPEGIFSTLFGTDFFAFVREGNRLGFFDGKTIIATEAGQKAHLDVIGADMTHGSWYGTGYPVAQTKDTRHKAFYDRYKARFNEEPELYSLAGYNIYTALAKAFEKAGSTDPQAVRDALKGMDIESPMGTVRIFAHNHRADFGVWLGPIADGKEKDTVYYDAGRYIGAKGDKP